MSKERKLDILLALFVGSLMAANFLGGKIVAFATPNWLAWILNIIFTPLFFVINAISSLFTDFGIISGETFLSYHFFDIVHVSVGILAVPLMFLVTDIIEDVMGKKKTKSFVNAAVISMIVVLAITVLAVWLPADSTRKYFSQESYAAIFGVSIRMMMASILAFFIAQRHDIWAFNFWKKKTHGKFLWLRNNASTFVSQFIDSTVFMFVAFYHLTPKFTVAYIFGLIIPYWIFKILFALLDTPFAYLGVRWLKKGDEEEK